MKKTYQLICRRRDIQYLGNNLCKYNITPIRLGLQDIDKYCQETTIEFLAKSISQDSATFTLKGKRKEIEAVIHYFLCHTELGDHYKLEERGY